MAAGSPNPLLTQLPARIRGDVAFDEVTRGIYATDASHYQVTPSCVVVPRDEQDALTAIRLANENNVPITARGGGTSLSGQTTWSGMVIDFTKYMNRVLEFNESEQWVRVQPGIILSELNAQLAPSRLHFAPDPATSNRAAIGGMIGNNSSGTRSIVYGKTIDNVLELRVALADGTILHLRPTDPNAWQAIESQPGREAEIYRGFRELMEREAGEIARRFPKVMRRVSGYNLDAFLPEQQGGQPGEWNLSNLIIGSEGTLAVLLEAKLKLVPLPQATALCVVHFGGVIDSLRAVDPILAHQPAAVELLDHVVLEEALRNPTTSALTDFIEGTPQAILIVEFFGDSPEHASQRAHDLAHDLQTKQIGYAHPVRGDAAGQQRVWDVRKLGLGLLANLTGARKPQAFIEDACVPTSILPEYIEQVIAICQKYGVEISIYAHASVGVLHSRPILDMHQAEDVELMRKIAYEVFELVKRYGGSWSGEHGDGLLRGEFIPEFFGPAVYRAFAEVKQLFDPRGLMNPGKIVAAPPMTENLRYGPHYHIGQLDTKFHYRDQGGFALAVEQCAGVGACRKVGHGTMCPSYMATRDEEHTTRGRANALRLAMSGQLGPDALASDRMHDVLKLCLSCKACKTECPTSVDMSRMKSEVLSLRHERRGTPLGARMLGSIPLTARRFAGALAPLVNWSQELPPIRWMLEKVAGIDRRRPLPRLHRRPFATYGLNSTTAAKNGHRQGQGETGLGKMGLGEVALFVDTFTNCYEPHVAAAAQELLAACGYVVHPLVVGCCQRPQISQGLLRQARRDGLKTLTALDEYAQRGLPILVLEPSCASALVDDLPDLIDEIELGQRVARQVQMIDVFLAQASRSGQLQRPFTSPHQRILLHGHCHQKAMFGTRAMGEIFNSIDGLTWSEVDSGCCGMAGAFGYNNYDLSEKIGEDRLFPAVRSRLPGTEVVACGISCRHQLHDFLRVQAKHWVEVVRVGD